MTQSVDILCRQITYNYKKKRAPDFSGALGERSLNHEIPWIGAEDTKTVSGRPHLPENPHPILIISVAIELTVEGVYWDVAPSGIEWMDDIFTLSTPMYWSGMTNALGLF